MSKLLALVFVALTAATAADDTAAATFTSCSCTSIYYKDDNCSARVKSISPTIDIGSCLDFSKLPFTVGDVVVMSEMLMGCDDSGNSTWRYYNDTGCVDPPSIEVTLEPGACYETLLELERIPILTAQGLCFPVTASASLAMAPYSLLVGAAIASVLMVLRW